MRFAVRSLAVLLSLLTLPFSAVTTRADDGPSLRCLDLPGANRKELATSDDGRFLTWTQKSPKTGLDEFHVWELATGKSVKVADDASSGRLFGNIVVSLHYGAGAKQATRVLRLGTVAVSPPELDAQSFIVDAPRKWVYFTTRHPTTKKAGVWRVALNGGEPTQLTEWGLAVGVVPDGSALILRAHNAKGELVKLPLDGGARVVLAENVATTYVLGDKVLFNPSVGDNLGPFAMTALDGSPSVPLTGDYRNSLGFSRSADVFQTWNRRTPISTLTRFDGKGGLVPVGRLDGARARAAVMLPDNKYVAVLVQQDTSDDGQQGEDDETDLCLAIASETAIHKVEPRKAPKRFTGLAARASMLLRDDLADASLKFVELEGKTTIVIESQGAGPTELPMGYGQITHVSSLMGELTAIAHNEDRSQSATTPDLLVRWRKNERHAAFEFDHVRDIGLPLSGAYGVSLMPREIFPFALAPSHRTQSNHAWSVPHLTVCMGTIENLGKETTDATIECGPSKEELGKDTPAPATVTLKGLAPGEKRKYTIKLGASKNSIHSIAMKVAVAGRPVLWFNDHALEEVRDLASLGERIEKSTGYKVSFGRSLASMMTLETSHDAPRLIAPGFSDKPLAEQNRIAKLVWKEFAAHYRTHHGDAYFRITIDDGTPKGRTVSSGELSKIETSK